MSEVIIDIERIKQTFEAAEEQANSEIRKKALSNFSKLGFPNRKSEDWKYTNLDKILKEGYAPLGSYEPGKLESSSFKSFKICKSECIRLVFVDGYFDKELSTLITVKGFHFITLKEGSQLDDTTILNESLIPLNTAFAKDGAIIKIDDGAIIDEPIEIYNITTCPGLKMIQPKHQIEVGKAAQVTFVESFHNLCVGSSFTNSVCSIKVERDAVVNFVKIEHPKKPNTYIIDHTMTVVFIL